MKLSGRVSGIAEMQTALQQLPAVLMDEMDAAARASAFQVTRTAQKNYLSGPRPGKLGVVTNRLRGSLTEGDPDFILDVQRQALQITVKVGTNVEYASTHEPPGGRTQTVLKSNRAGGFLAVPTAFAKTPAGAVKDVYNRPLRQIEGLFVQRATSGILFAALKAPASGRRRRSTFLPLFWLLRSVTIPARPFLAPALQDTMPWMEKRSNQAVRHVDHRMNALLKGR